MGTLGMRRTPIVTRLVAAFICVSLLPIGTFATLAIYESRVSQGAPVNVLRLERAGSDGGTPAAT